METTQMPYTDEWVKKMWRLYTMECYSVRKNNEIPFAGKWMKPNIILVSEVRQIQKDKGHMFSLS
jgi:hypothetical protein